MTPTFSILVGDEDYTAVVNDRLIELRLVDLAGWKSDYLELVLDDREEMKRPTHGAKIMVQLGYAEDKLYKMGTYTHDETEFAGPPKRMIIRAAGINFREKLKAPRTRSLDDVTLGGLVEGIAAEHGYSAYVDEFLKEITVPHIDQTAESDLRLLTRLAAQYNALFKATGTSLLMVPKGGKKSAAVKDALGSVTLTPGDVTSWRVPRQDKSRYSGVRATWYDFDAAQLKSAIAGDDSGNVRELPTQYPSQQEAWQAANAELEKLIRSKADAEITLPGRPDLTAEGGLVLEGFRDGVDDEYTITRVEHTYTKRGGYKCKVQAELSNK